jgi:hypothetical protein
MKWFLLCSFAMVLTQCKSRSGSDLNKSVDNFARSKNTPIRINDCGRDMNAMSKEEKEDYDLWFSKWFQEGAESGTENQLPYIRVRGQNQELARTTLKRVLSAVPLNLLMVYFETGNIIHIDDQEEVNTVCRGSFSNDSFQAGALFDQAFAPTDRIFMAEGQGNILEADLKNRSVVEGIQATSCWNHNTTSNLQRYEIWITNAQNESGKMAAIEHSVIRMFSYLLANVFIGIDLDDQFIKAYNSNNKAIPEMNGLSFSQNKEFLELLEHFAKAFENDVAKLASSPKAAQYGNDIYTMTGESNTRAFDQRRKMYLFAEGLDSMLCSSDTKDVFFQDFPGSFEVMTEVIRELEDLDISAELSGDTTGSIWPIHEGVLYAQGPVRNIARGAFRGVGRVALGTALVGRGVAARGRVALIRTGQAARNVAQATRFVVRRGAVRMANGVALVGGAAINTARFTRNVVRRTMGLYPVGYAPRWRFANGSWRTY